MDPVSCLLVAEGVVAEGGVLDLTNFEVVRLKLDTKLKCIYIFSRQYLFSEKSDGNDLINLNTVLRIIFNNICVFFPLKPNFKCLFKYTCKSSPCLLNFTLHASSQTELSKLFLL